MPVQFSSPAPQLTAHAPPEQTMPAEHAVPQAPQLRLSVWRSRHVPAQLVSVEPQLTAHAPVAQT